MATTKYHFVDIKIQKVPGTSFNTLQIHQKHILHKNHQKPFKNHCFLRPSKSPSVQTFQRLNQVINFFFENSRFPFRTAKQKKNVLSLSSALSCLQSSPIHDLTTHKSIIFGCRCCFFRQCRNETQFTNLQCHCRMKVQK